MANNFLEGATFLPLKRRFSRSQKLTVNLNKDFLYILDKKLK
jgi:hypothetical protein